MPQKVLYLVILGEVKTRFVLIGRHRQDHAKTIGYEI